MPAPAIDASQRSQGRKDRVGCGFSLGLPRPLCHDAVRMPPAFLFWSSLAATVGLMVATLVTGLRRRRRPHLWLGPLTMVSLAVTIVLTEQLMARYDFPAEVRAIHLPCAKAGGLLALPVVLTGLWLWRRPSARRWHQVAVVVWLVSVLVATGTGLWMFSHGVLKTG